MYIAYCKLMDLLVIDAIYICVIHGIIPFQVTEREGGGWKNWKWRSSNDAFLNGAYFVQSGWGSSAPNYLKTQSFSVSPASMVPSLTANAGPLSCVAGKPCTI